jgi:hypothetical protein
MSKSQTFLLYLIVFIFGSSRANSDGTLCKIELYLTDQPVNEKKLGANNPKTEMSDISKIYTQTFYQVVCVTDEPVRARNFIQLIRTDTSSQNKLQLSNTTIQDNGYSYMEGGLLLNESDLNANLSLFCRFLTQNPSVYCEKTVHLMIKAYPDIKLRIFIAVLCVLVLIGFLSIMIRIYLGRKKNKENESKQNALRKMSSQKVPFAAQSNVRKAKRYKAIVSQPNQARKFHSLNFKPMPDTSKINLECLDRNGEKQLEFIIHESSLSTHTKRPNSPSQLRIKIQANERLIY